MHVALLQAERSLLISGDVLLPRFRPWYDYGHSADPVGEFQRSLDVLAARASDTTALPGHGRPVTDLSRLIASYRTGVGRRLERVEQALGQHSGGAYEVGRRVFRDASTVRARVRSTSETVAISVTCGVWDGCSGMHRAGRPSEVRDRLARTRRLGLQLRQVARVGDRDQRRQRAHRATTPPG